jgi:hypothetical protein
MKKASILDLPEDLLEEDQPHPPSEPTLDRLVTEVSNILGITSQELSHWVKESVVPEEVLKLILRTALRFKLNPLLGQVDWELNLDGSYEVYIPIDGWIAIIHREPSFKGLTFSQATEIEEGIPIWMECSIYRADLIQPITVREYFAELKTDHPIWNQMPRRMLRHKTLQQCARLAFGIGVPEFSITTMASITKKKLVTQTNQRRLDSKALLKEKLNIN